MNRIIPDIPEHPSFDTIDQIDYDVAIIGAGINGAGVARECALRGRKVLLIDQADFGAATSSMSSKLAHGGLRYLKNIQFGLVYEALRERYLLFQNAPHLVQPSEFLLPIYSESGYPSWMIRLGVWIYDVLASFRTVHRHHYLDSDGVKRREPQLKDHGLEGGVVYSDGVMDDARLCLENVLQARQLGAHVFNYVRLEREVVVDHSIQQLVLKDIRSGLQRSVAAKCVVQTVGPWTDQLARTLGRRTPNKMRMSKGVHIVVDADLVGTPLLVTSNDDKRVFFIIPWFGVTLIGTTDHDYSQSPDHVEVSDDDIDYLLNSVNDYFQDIVVNREDITASFAGVRPLVSSAHSWVSDVSRTHKIWREKKNMFVLAGGKYTNYRAVSEQVARRVERFFKRGWFFRSMTRNLPLYGGEISDLNRYATKKYPVESAIYPVDKTLYRHVVMHYGSVYSDVLSVICEDETYQVLLSGTLHYRGEVIYAIRHECARTIEDFMRRRTRLFFSKGNGYQCLTEVAELFQQECGWTDDQFQCELADYQRFVQASGVVK